MKIERIKLSNIYGHREADVDLSSLDAAVVVGHNGAGKSSLFVDGPLFALYGRTAVRGSSLSNIVRHGEETGVADVWFRLDAELYHVRRTYSVRTKAGSSSATLSKLDAAGNVAQTWDGKIAEVDAAIIDLIGADYQAFTLGAIMRQGQSDHFTALTATERIKALAQIVGVEHLRDGFERAGSRQHELKASIASCRDKLDELASVRVELDNVEADLEALVETIQEADVDVVEEDARVERLASDAQRVAKDLAIVNNELDDKRTELDRLSSLRERQVQLLSERTELGERASKLERALEQVASNLTTDTTSVDVWRARVHATSAELDELREVLDSVRGYEASNAEIRRTLDKTVAAEDYTKDRARQVRRFVSKLVREAEIAGIIKRSDDSPADGLPTSAQVREAIDTEQAKQDRAKAELASQRHLKQVWTSAADELQRESVSRQRQVETLTRRAEALKQRPDECDMNQCPLIRSALEASDDLDRLAADTRLVELDRERLDAKRAYEESTDIDVLDVEIEFRDKTISALERICAPLEELETCAATLSSMNEVSALKLVDIMANDAEIDGLIDAVSEYVEGEVDKSLHDWGSTLLDETIEKRRSKLDETIASLSLARARDEAQPELDEKRQQIDAIMTQIEDITSSVDDLARQLSDSFALSAQAKRLQDERDAYTNELRELDERKVEAQKQLDAARARSSKLDTERVRLETVKGRLVATLEEGERVADRLSDLKHESNELSYAREFLKVAPSIVVGSAIPRLERVANDILADISPGTTIQIERQRETKSGERRDEIHIVVISEGVARDIETFSGGERFRIDVALRLALARAAAGRSTGRPLETLIVDEGWGSLDADGVDKLKETFARLADRFARILVVTHVDAVADTFARLIEVTSGTHETRVSII